MKNYSYTALSLLVCVTASGCYSERVKAIEEGVTEDAGDGTRSEGPSKTSEEDLTDAGPSGSTTAEPTSSTKPKPPKPKPDPSDDSDETDTTSEPTDTSDPNPTTTTPDPTTEPPTEEDEFFHPTPEGDDTTEPQGSGGNHGGFADAGVPGGNETVDWGESTSASSNTGTSPGANTSDDGDYSDDGAGEPGEDGSEPDEGPSPGEIIEEADVIRREGDILYALSFSAGLAVVDVSDPANLELLGRIEFDRTATEMYLDGSEVVVLFQGEAYDDYYYDYWYGYTNETTIGVYDVSNPAEITEIDSETISGSLLDSRKIGDRLYVAANGDCYSCEDGGPSVGSFNLAGSGIELITSIDIPVSSDGSYTPTLYANNDRLYLAQENWGYVDSQGNPVPWEVVYGSTDSTSSDVTWAQTESVGATGAATNVIEAVDGGALVDAGSTESEPTTAVDGGSTVTDGTSGSGGYTYANWTVLQVVDIADDSGAMTLGASVRIDGSVRSRWQMDEHDGVLRVVSQDGWTGPAPVVETFTVEDSATITKVGHLEIELPRPETLQSVRFDGDRGYVVTFEQVDPLFTLDLSDPAAPKQVGELEIPGFLYHMIPRGDRLYAVGYDNSNEDSLHASLFDVSDLANPVMLKRVNFGGQWGWFGEQQDDIEKSVQLLDEQGLMLIPFTGYDYSDNNYCGYEHSGIQLIDYSEDDLTLRGVTDAVGYARRAFYHRDHLFGYSDRAIQTFDISDRDNPVAVDALAFAHSVEQVVVVGDKLVRIGDDGFETTFIDVVPVSTPNAPIQSSALTLDAASSCNSVSYFRPIARDGIVYLPRQVYDYVDYTSNVTLLAVDVTNPSGPTKLTELGLAEDAGDLEDIRVLKTQNALVVSQRRASYEWVEVEGSGEGDSTAGAAQTMDYFEDDYYDYGYYDTVRTLRLDVVDTREVGATLNVATVDVDQEWLDNGFASSSDQISMSGDNGYQHSLVAGGNLVVSQHRVYEPDGSGYRYFAERLDVSNPAQPTWLAAVNVPGQALTLSDDDVHLVTADSVTVPLDEAECSQSQYDDYIVCYNRMIELSALTLEEQRAVRHAKVRLGSNNNSYSVAFDSTALYTQRNDYDSNNDDVVAYAYDLEPLGKLQAYPGSLTDWYGVPVLVGYSDGYESAALISTESGELKETARAADVQCDPAVVGETAVYCAAGFDGVDVTPLE